jgi:hypothetical protein
MLAVTAVGDAKISTAQSKFGGSAGYFDGSGDYLSIASNPLFNFDTGDFTIELWAKLPNDNVDYSLISGSANGNMDLRREATGYLSLGRSYVAWDANSSVMAIANQWAHIAVSRSGSTLRMFCNGVQIYSGSNTVSYSVSNLQIGRTSASYGDLSGYIDELRITKGIARYNSNFTIPSSAYPDNTYTPVTATVIDLTKNKITGTFTNGVDYNIFNGGSLVFDGTNDYITSPTSTLFNFGTGDFTIEMWVYPTSVKTFSLLDFRINETNPNGNAFVIGTSASNFWVVYQNGNQITGPTVVANQWVQVVVNRVGTAVKMFLNGVQAGSTWTTSNTFTDGAFVLGTDYPLNARFFQGNVSSVKIYKAKGLNNNEILQNYNAIKARFGL